MYDLLTRTVSQALQALMPVAIAIAWYRQSQRDAAGSVVAALRWTAWLSVPATLTAGFLFQRAQRQSIWEAALALAAVVIAFAFRQDLRSRPDRAPTDGRARSGLAGAAALLLIVRQTMEIDVTINAAIAVRSGEFLAVLACGVAVAIAAAALWMRVTRRLRPEALARATHAFAVVFIAQAAFYAFHESAEAGLLPASAVLHAATEPYGPDGLYGRYISLLLVAVPLIVAAPAWLRAYRAAPGAVPRRRLTAAIALLALAGVAVSLGVYGWRRPADPAPASSETEIAALAPLLASPHLLFRTTAPGRTYGTLAVAPLDPSPDAPDAPDAPPAPPAPRAPRAPQSTSLSCDRIAYAGGRGACLVANGELYTKYEALFLDRDLRVSRRLTISGRPSRTRISPDGAFAATTVFETGLGHEYAIDGFATTTTLFDLRNGTLVGNLEQFAASRDGRRFAAADFNYWGVTFARDSGTFYATLQTAGKRYLVRGDIARREVVVMLENVECPSISPGNRRLAYKKRVRAGARPWRFYVLDLQTMTERPIEGETRSIDDQLEWLDDAHVLYGVPRAAQGPERDIWIAAVDGAAPARVFLSDGESPVVVR